jgi:hypothetical protein
MGVPRKSELRRKRARRAKLAFLRERYQEAKNADERAKILEKAARVAPGVKLV